MTKRTMGKWQNGQYEKDGWTVWNKVKKINWKKGYKIKKMK